MDKAEIMDAQIDFGSVLEGGHFAFIVGPEKRRFEVHSSLLSMHSRPLGAMMSNPMVESETRAVVLDDIDPATFIQFAEFIYRGRYTINAPATHLVKQEQTFEEECREIEQKEMEVSPDGFSFYCRACGKYVHPMNGSANYPYHNTNCKDKSYKPHPICTRCGNMISGKGVICEKCEDLLFSSSCSQETVKGWSQFTKRFADSRVKDQYATRRRSRNSATTASSDLSPHAKVWVFADRYDVPSLQQLSLHKLHSDLVAYDLKPESVKEVVELIQYVYKNTFVPEPERNSAGILLVTNCELRDLVVAYAACQADTLVETREFCIMLQGGGEVASDFGKAVTKRGN